MGSRALVAVLGLWCVNSLGFDNTQESLYLSAFPDIVASSYSSFRSPALMSTCVNKGPVTLTPKVLVGKNLNAADAQLQCSNANICELPAGATLTMNSNFDIGALVVKGTLIWTDSSQPTVEQFLCAGYIAVDGGSFRLFVEAKQAVIYIKDNGAYASHPTRRGFVGYNGAVIDIQGKFLERTWSLLALPAKRQSSNITLMHDAAAMGWSVGDRIVIAPTKPASTGTAESYYISGISGTNVSLTTLNGATASLGQDFAAQADWIDPAWTAQRQAEVIMMTRHVLITGDDFVHEPCEVGALLSDANITCVCTGVRKFCTRGLHTALQGNGTFRLQYSRVEKCGQRGIVGKYCVHLHVAKQCPNCLIRGNSIEYSHQRGIVVHATSLATVEFNVMNDVRGANIYLEDGNEMYNRIRYNVLICPWAQVTQPGQPERYACSVPGTDNDQADTSVNQAAIWALSFSNFVIGNRAANSFNGMLYQGQSFENGRQTTVDALCPNQQSLGRLEGNTFHGHGRFGTYVLAAIFPKKTTRSLLTGGLVANKDSCAAFDADGNDRGLSQVVSYNVDYENIFVGQYGAGDIQYLHHTSIFNNNLIYWKETKNFADGCSAHVKDSWWQGAPGQGASLPGGHGTVILENMVFKGEVNFESSHHCNVGTTGVLCMPTYLFVRPTWQNVTGSTYVRWGPNNGAMFVLGPDDCANPNGVMFPAGYCSLANPFWTYLLPLNGGLICRNASSISGQAPSFAAAWGQGIFCRAPLRRLEIFTKGQTLASAPNVKLELWQASRRLSSVIVRYFQIADDGSNTGKQGYAMTVLPGLNHEYRLSLENGGPIPADWAIEFSDLVFGNRWVRDEIRLIVAGRNCSGVVHSHHDRRFLWGDTNDFNGVHNWLLRPGRGACSGFPDMPKVSCSQPLSIEEACPGKCPPCGTGQFCDCGTGTCVCQPGSEGPNCVLNPCAAANCDPRNGRCSARFLGGALPVALGQCVCKPGSYGPRCVSDPCLCASCGSHGKCVKTSATTYYCQCDAGYEGLTCNATCTDCAPPCIDGCRYYDQKGIVGPDLASLPVDANNDGPIQCCGACKANASCRAFFSPGFCYLKTGQTANLFSMPGTTSGVLCEPLPPVNCPDTSATNTLETINIVWVAFVAMMFV